MRLCEGGRADCPTGLFCVSRSAPQAPRFFYFDTYIRRNMYQYLAEFFGTMFFIYVILATGNPLAIGAALALVLLLVSKISGGYINPAVSIVMASAGKLSTNELIPYILAQVFGGLVALELFKRYKL